MRANASKHPRHDGVCPDCGGPKAKKDSKRCFVCHHRRHRGENHHLYGTGERANAYGHARARRMYPLEGVTCEAEACEAPATDRHHVDGDTWNNERSNVRFLCRRHHMVADGRLERLRAMDAARWKPGRNMNPKPRVRDHRTGRFIANGVAA